MKELLRHSAAEFVGTFALVFVGGGAIMMTQNTEPTAALVTVALAHGLILALMVSATMRISGHLNPAVTIGILVARRISVLMAGVHIVAQLLGAVAAAFALKHAMPAGLIADTNLGLQKFATSISTGQGFALEAIATFFLVFVVFGTAVDPKGPKIGGLAIGLTVAADIMAIGPMTGASMNPARTFGPAMMTGIFEGHLLYWLAPITGAVVAALLYDTLFLRGDDAPAT